MTAVLPRVVPTDSPGRWRGHFLRVALLPTIVLAPLGTLALGADHRYNVYWHGAVVRDRPWALITENVRTVPMYLDFGNFRPLGRALEWAVDAVAYLLIELLHLPAEAGLRIVAALAAVVLTAAATLFAEAVTTRGRLFAEPPARPVALLPFAVAAGLVASGPLSTAVLFGGLYYLSAALVLAVAAWFCREPRPAPLILLAGALLAMVNEVAALAVPLATAAVLARARFVLGLDGRAALSRLRPVGLLWLGFLPIFGPVRVLIWYGCHRGECYPGSDLALGPGAAAALPNRVTAWLPPVQWYAAFRTADPPGRVAVIVAVLVFGLMAVRLWRERPAALDRRQVAGLAAAGAAVLLAGAALGAVSVPGQAAAAAGRWGAGWRDGGLTAAGGALLAVALLGLIAREAAGRAALGVLALLAAGSAVTNQAYAGRANRAPAAVLNNAIAAEVAQFEDSGGGNARRCALRQRFAATYRNGGYSAFARGELPGTGSSLDRFDVTVNLATEQLYGRRFCR